MISYNSLTAALIWIAIFNLVLFVIAWALGRMWSRDVTLEVTQMSRPARWWEGTRLRTWRLLAGVLWRSAGHLSGGRKAWAEDRSRRCTMRAQRIERRRRRRARDAERLDASLRAWGEHMKQIHGSFLSSPPSLPPSAPRPTLDPAEEDTRRWERTLPWGTPSSLLTREGRGRPYPFVPLAPPLPRSSRRGRRAP